MRKIRRSAALFLGAVILCISAALIMYVMQTDESQVVYGATFSTKYARDDLKLDWQEVYTAMLDELQVRHVRIPLYWSDIESTPDVYDFSDTDWMMDQAQERGAQVTLVVGQKVPRWPECFIPEWASSLEEGAYEEALFDYVQTAVLRYRTHEALARWQVENEPSFPFGECPKPNRARLEREILLVRSLDAEHPIQRTTSGEQSLWVLHTGAVDILGTSLYRQVWTRLLGHVTFPLPALWYRAQTALAQPFVRQVIISELQAEPWFGKDDPGMEDAAFHAERFTEQDLLAHIRFAERTGAGEVYLWGIEWWWYLKSQGYPQLWETGQALMK